LLLFSLRVVGVFLFVIVGVMILLELLEFLSFIAKGESKLPNATAAHNGVRCLGLLLGMFKDGDDDGDGVATIV